MYLKSLVFGFQSSSPHLYLSSVTVVVAHCGLRCKLSYLLPQPTVSWMTYNSGLYEIKHNHQHTWESEVLGCEYPLRQISDQLGPEVIFKCFSSSLFLRSLPKWMGLEYISYGSSEISANLSIQPPVVVDSSVKHFQFSSVQFSSVQFSHSIMSDSLWPHEL